MGYYPGKVVAVTMVKNEEDILPSTLAHMMSQVDHVIVADNMSTDNTRPYLDLVQGLNPDKLIVIDDLEVGYMQSAKMTMLARRARYEFGADWIVPFDADEFWYSPFGRIKDVLAEQAPQWLVAPAALYNHFTTDEDPPELGNPLRRIGWRQRERAPLHKVACRYREDLTILQGNHGALYDGGGTIIDGLLIVRHFPYRSAEQFCNTPEAPIWMFDLGFKDLGDVKVGDVVMGHGPFSGVKKSCLLASTVLQRHTRLSPIIRVEMASGRVLRCSPDHLWRQHGYGCGTIVPGVRGAPRRDGKGFQDVRVFGEGTYLPPKVGRSLSHVITPSPAVKPPDDRLAGWLAGMFDGEGCMDRYRIEIAQSAIANSELCDRIRQALEYFGFPYTQMHDRFVLQGGRQTYVDFINMIQPYKRRTGERVPRAGNRRLRDLDPGTMFGEFSSWGDKVISIEPDGEEEVIGLTTTTGNYVAWGYASKNCRKAIQGAAAYAATDLPESEGAHWRSYGRLAEAHGPEVLHGVYREWFHLKGKIDLEAYIYDPAIQYTS